MKRIVIISSLGLAFILLVLCLASTRAELVQHHGATVDSRGDAASCLRCHDGSTAQGISTCIGIRCEFASSHPVNRDYPPVGNRNKFVSAEEIKAAGVVLINGQVTCVSCHELTNPDRFHLIKDNRNSNLCIQCHIR